MAEAKVAMVGESPTSELGKVGEAPKDLDTSDNRSSSPEPNCAICLSRPKNKSFTDSCLHQFCFSCLLEWSKVKPECPLCKQTFRCIIHNIRSLDDYDKYLVHTPPAVSTELLVEEYGQIVTGQNERFRYRTTMVFPYRPIPAEDIQNLYQSIINSSDSDFYNLRSYVPSSTDNYVLPTTRRQSRRNLRYGTSDFRRNIYRHNLWARPMPDVSGRYRESSPAFYRLNEALSHRLVPWLNRELNVLLRRPEQQNDIIELILRFITQYPIRSPEFTNLLTPFIGEQTRHFVHEFYSYAVSPFDLVGYDQQVNYVSYAELGHDPDEGMNIPSDSDSDIQIVEETNGPSTERNNVSIESGTNPSITTDDSDSDCIVLDEVTSSRRNIELIEVLSDSDEDTAGDIECVEETKPYIPTISGIEISSDDDFFCIDELPPVKDTTAPKVKSEEPVLTHEMPSTSGVSSEGQQETKRKTRGNKSLSYHLDMLEDISDSNEEWLPNGKKSRKTPKMKKRKKKEKLCCCARQKLNKHWKKELLNNLSDNSDSHSHCNSNSDPEFPAVSTNRKASVYSKHRKNIKSEPTSRKLDKFRFKYKKYCCEHDDILDELSSMSDATPSSYHSTSTGDESTHHYCRSKSKKSLASADDESFSLSSKNKLKKSLGNVDNLFNSKTLFSNSKCKSAYSSSRKSKKSKVKKSTKTQPSDYCSDWSSSSDSCDSSKTTHHHTNFYKKKKNYSPGRYRELHKKQSFKYPSTENPEAEVNKFFVGIGESDMPCVESSSSPVDANNPSGARPRLKSVVRVVNSNWKNTNSVPHYEIVSSSLHEGFADCPGPSTSKSYDSTSSSSCGPLSSSTSTTKNNTRKKTSKK